MTDTSTNSKQVPSFSSRRLLLLGTGAASASFLPFWLNWLRDNYPALEVRAALTRSAERFVTPQTVALLTGTPVLRDEWGPEPEPAAVHVELVEWADSFAIFPASANFIARLALGLCDTPVLLALHCTRQVIGIAPSVPPGMTDSPAFAQHVRALEDRPNMAIAPTQVGRSATTGRYNQGVAAPMWVLIEQMEKRRATLSATADE